MGIQLFTSQSQYRYYFILGVLNIFLSVSKKSLERENEKCLLIVSTAFNGRLKKILFDQCRIREIRALKW